MVGPNADDLYNQLGDYTPPLRRDDGITVLDGMKLIFKESDIRFSQGCYLRKRDENLLKEAVDTVKNSDIVICVLGGSAVQVLTQTARRF